MAGKNRKKILYTHLASKSLEEVNSKIEEVKVEIARKTGGALQDSLKGGYDTKVIHFFGIRGGSVLRFDWLQTIRLPVRFKKRERP
jgi:hypothetical protein